jgi:hypothetical protein
MSDQINWQDLESAVGSITDDTQFAGLQQTQEGGLRRLKLLSGAAIRSWIAALAQTITGLWTFSGGIVTSFISLVSGRKFAEEKDSVISATGYHVIAIIRDGNISGGSGGVKVTTTDRAGRECEFGIRTSNSARTSKNTYIEQFRGWGESNGEDVEQFRMGKSDSDHRAGALLEVKLNTTDNINTLLNKNFDRSGNYQGWELVEAYPSDGLLPDGSTASYLEAGAELESVSGITFMDQRIGWYAATATSLRLTILFDIIPKQDATTITFPVGFILKRSDGTTAYAVTAGDTVPVDSVKGKSVTGVITTSGLTAGQLGFATGVNISVELS